MNRRLMLVLVAYFASVLVVMLSDSIKLSGPVSLAIMAGAVAWVFNDMRPKH